MSAINLQYKPLLEVKTALSLVPGKQLQVTVILALQTCQLQHELYVLSLLYCVQDSKSNSKTT